MKKETLDKIVSRLDQLPPSELRQLFLRISADKGLLEEIFDALRDGIILFDASGNASLANRAAARIYGKDKRELLGENFEILVGNTCTWADLSQSGIALTRDLHVNYPEQRHYNFLMMPLSGEAEYLLIIQDDTEARAEHEENAQAEQMNLLSFLASGVAHELGNPVNSLALNLQLMQRKLKKMPHEAQEALEGLLQTSLAETRRLDVLIKEFLQSMRPSKLKRSSVCINKVIAEVMDVLSPEIEPRGITVHQELNENLPELQADAGQLFQVFYNLIRNAFQSIPGSDGDILIQSSATDQDVVVRICDTGCGISHEVIGRLYEAFRTTKNTGNGLGLLIVRRIIKEHGGTIALASKPGTGTTVTLSLPRADRVTRLLSSLD